MSMSDPIADMLTRIRNAGKAKFKSVDIPGSQVKGEIARVLKEEGYIRNFKMIRDNKQGIIRVYLKYEKGDRHVIYGIGRASKPSRRMYTRAKDVKPVLNHMGVAILSTSKGVMTDKAARKNNVGGEVLCTIW